MSVSANIENIFNCFCITSPLLRKEKERGYSSASAQAAGLLNRFFRCSTLLRHRFTSSPCFCTPCAYSRRAAQNRLFHVWFGMLYIPILDFQAPDRSASTGITILLQADRSVISSSKCIKRSDKSKVIYYMIFPASDVNTQLMKSNVAF